MDANEMRRGEDKEMEGRQHGIPLLTISSVHLNGHSTRRGFFIQLSVVNLAYNVSNDTCSQSS